MKFKDMPYERPDLGALKETLAKLTASLRGARSYEEAREVFLQKERESRHLSTLVTLVSVRHSIDTRDQFYDGEMNFWNSAMPELEEYDQEWTMAMLESPFRADFEREYGTVWSSKAEMSIKTFSPDIIPELKRENDLVTEYGKLVANAQIEFEGGTYTIPELGKFKTDADDNRRHAAWRAEGQWWHDHRDEAGRIYDELTHLRDACGRKLGYDGYTQLGYYRMTRNSYTKKDVERFREAVRRYLVPVADGIYKKLAERIGRPYPLSFADSGLWFRSGNPRPLGSAEDILEAGRKFYTELSPETGEFFNMMLSEGLMDVLSKEGKEGGGYCTSFDDYGVPFIFANFNGTQGDVEVVTHEAGHAFAMYVNRDRVPSECIWPTMEGCEVHSMSMEFMAWPWAEDFFGEDARKFRYNHLAGAVTFIPYGTMVDHFQHIVYERPNMTPDERHGVWRELLGVYMPWMRLDGEIPFYSEGEGWMRQSHIFSSPFYYIDYCLAQTVSLEFWALLQEDRKLAWERYMAYTRQGGSRVFTELLANAGLESPFEGETLRKVCERAGRYLENYDLTGIE